MIIGALLVALPSPASGDELSERQARARRQRAEITTKIDLARASDSKLEAEVARLSKATAAQTARLQRAEQAQWAAETEVAAQSARLAEVEARAKRVRDELEKRAVYAYLHPPATLFEGLAKSATLAEAGRRIALLGHVQASSTATLERYRDARSDLAAVKARHEQVKERAAARARAEAAERDSLALAERSAAAAKEALSRRIAGLQGEAAALAATDAQIQAILASRAAENAAILAAARPAAPPVPGVATTRAGAPTTAGRGGNTPTTKAATPAPAAGGYVWPVRGPVTSEYGYRWDGFHSGIDIGAGSGTPIRSARAGVVSYASWMDGGWGNIVLVDHGDGVSTAYAHQSSITTRVGQVVTAGQTLGHVGCTGNCTGDHLHFELRVGGAPQNPRSHIRGGP